MNIWLLQANEPMPIVHEKQRLYRMGLIAKELNKRSHKIRWFATTFDHYKKEQLYNKDKIIEVNENYKLDLIWAPSYKNNISIKRIINHKYMAFKFRIKASKLDKPDLIYTSFPTIEFAEEAIRYGKENNIPVLVDVRDLWPDIFNHNLSKLKRIIAFPYIQYMQYKTKKIMKNAYAINGISPLIMEWGIKKANRECKDIDKSFYMGYEKNSILQKELNIKDFNNDSFNLCFFGTLNNQFEFDKIVKIAELIKEYNANIYICGTGQEYDKLYKESLRLPNLKLLGWVNKEQLQYILQNSKIGLAPYKPTFDFQMSVSNKFAEYLSYGLPVVLTSGGYMGKLIEENECGINSSDEEKIAKFIIKMMKNIEIYDKMSENAKKLYEENFVAEKIYSDLVDYLEKIV